MAGPDRGDPGLLRPRCFDGTGGREQSQVACGLLGRRIGDPPVVLTVSPRSAVPYRQVGGDRNPGYAPEGTMLPPHT